MSSLLSTPAGQILQFGAGVMMSAAQDMLTQDEYDAWMQNPDAERILLVIFDVEVGLETKHYYFSSWPYKTTPNDTPANIVFRPFIYGSPSFERRIEFLSDEGDSEAGSNDDNGSFDIDNSDGALDGLASQELQKRPIQLMLGDPTWPFSYFQQYAQVYRIEDADYSDDQTVSISLYDRLGELDDPIQETLLTTGPKADEPVPDLFGYGRNISPVLIDANNERYKWNRNESQEMAEIYEDGVDNLLHTAYLADSEVTRDSQVRGTITLDAKGHKHNGNWLNTTGGIVRHIVTGIGPWMDPDDLDIDSFTEFETAVPYTVGYYTGAQHTNRIDVIEDLLSGVSGFYTTTLRGRLRIGRIKIPYGLTPVAEFRAHQISEDSFKVEQLNQVRWRTRIAYQRNWTTQQRSSLTGSVQEDADRAGWLAEEFRIAKYEEIQTPGKIDPPEEQTYIDELVDGATEAEYRQAILGVQRFLCTLEVGAEGSGVLPGDIIRIFDDRYGMQAGVEAQVLSVKVFYLDNIVQLEAWY